MSHKKSLQTLVALARTLGFQPNNIYNRGVSSEHSAKNVTSNDGQRRIRTEGGSKKYHGPIGAPITKHMIEEAAKSSKNLVQDVEKGKSSITGITDNVTPTKRSVMKVVGKSKSLPVKDESVSVADDARTLSPDRKGKLNDAGYFVPDKPKSKPGTKDGKIPDIARIENSDHLNALKDGSKVSVFNSGDTYTKYGNGFLDQDGYPVDTNTLNKFADKGLVANQVSDNDYEKDRNRIQGILDKVIDSKQTIHTEQDADGNWKPERTEMHEKILDALTKKAESVPNDHQIVMSAGLGGAGKALALDTEIPTPTGWRKLRSIEVDDLVYGSDGYPYNVISVTSTVYNHTCYRISFSDGTDVVADAGHFWSVKDSESRILWENRLSKIMTTQALAKNGISHTGEANFRIALPEAIFGNDEILLGPKTNLIIVEISKIDPVPVRCISVDSPDNLFLITRSYIPTHNSTVLTKFAGIDSKNYVTINPDDFKELIAEHDGAPKIPGLSPAETAALTHQESSFLAKEFSSRMLSQGKNIIFDVTMGEDRDDRGSNMLKIAEYKKAGYKIDAVFVDIPVPTSIKRANARHRRGMEFRRSGTGWGGRYVPNKIIAANAIPDEDRNSKNKDFWSRNREVFEQLKPEFRSWRIYDNSVDKRDPKLKDEDASKSFARNVSSGMMDSAKPSKSKVA